MDNTTYEQEHLITIKSSSVALLYNHKKEETDENERYIINLLDSPGHMDFSHEVSSALRLTDGCLVVVDAVEGVCIQTRAVLRQAWQEKVKPCLVINKIDKLIMGLSMTPEEAYERILRVLEQANEAIAGLWVEQYVKKESEKESDDIIEGDGAMDDEDVYFSPDKGNVAFASAIHGWAFTIDKFCELFSAKLKLNKRVLQKTLWGTYYFSPKTKKIFRKPPTPKTPPMFVQFILKSIWDVYNAITPEKDLEKMEKINKAMNLGLTRRELNHEDSTFVISNFMSQWLPLSQCLLGMIVNEIPSPREAQKVRMTSLWKRNYLDLSEDQKVRQNNLEISLSNCDSSNDAPLIVYVSKVFSVSNAELLRKTYNKLDRQGHSFIAMARVFSGTLKIGQKVHIMGPRYQPSVPDKHRTELEISQLYLLMGPSIESIEEVRAGQVFGIGGDEFVKSIVKTATISSDPVCPAFDALRTNANPIVRVAVQPVNSTDLSQFEQGLRLLYLGDPAIDLDMQENGEHIIGTLGELHLSRCLQLLEEDFAKVPIKASPPIVSFRESILSSLAKDVKTNVIVEPTKDGLYVKVSSAPLPMNITRFLEANSEVIRKCMLGQSEIENDDIRIFRDNLRVEFSKAGKEWASLEEHIWSLGPKRIGPNILFNCIPGYSKSPFWTPAHLESTQVYLKCRSDNGFEIIDDELSDKTIGKTELIKYYILQQLDNRIKTSFQISSKAGPLCEEPLYSVAFFIHDIAIRTTTEMSAPNDDSSGEEDDEEEIKKNITLPETLIESEKVPNLLETSMVSVLFALKSAFRKSFESHSQRVYEAYYHTFVQVNLEAIGKVYSVLSKRRAQIITDEINDSSGNAIIQAHIPATESFGFAEELYSKTAGAASAQLSFSHWDLLDVDPNFVPTTEDEIEEFGDNIGGITPNLARKYIDGVRKRKGLKVKEKLVEFANKQRTLSKKK